jgi:integrase/recombinase XerC
MSAMTSNVGNTSSGVRASDIATHESDVFGQCACAAHCLHRVVIRLIDDELPTEIDAVYEIVGEMFTLLADVAPSTRHELLKHFNRFIAWCRMNDIRDLRGVGREQAETFINQPIITGRGTRKPSFPTRRNRRLAMRRAYMILRTLGYKLLDPTIDVVLPSPSAGKSRACSDSELERLRKAIQPDLYGISHSSLLALAEAGATNTEISSLTMSAVDLGAGSVRLHGTHRTRSRTNPLTTWGLAVLEHRAEHAQPDEPIVRNADGNAASTAVVSQYFDLILSFARVYGRRLTIDSVRYWGARQAYERTGRVEDAAYFLGNVSLNTTATGICLDWRTKS